MGFERGEARLIWRVQHLLGFWTGARLIVLARVHTKSDDPTNTYLVSSE